MAPQCFLLILISIISTLYPQFGRKAIGKSREKIRNSKNFSRGKFINKEDTSVMTGFHFKTFVDYFKNESWSNIHMMPEDTVQAHIDLKGKALLPIHWAAFKLSVHSWNEPVERAVKQASKSNVKIITPQIGEVIDMGKTEVFTEWWK